MKTLKLSSLLRSNPYPGRGILIGRAPDNRHVVTAYFIMGRSENSRNRIFVSTPDGIRTQAKDPAKLTDSSLIIYAPVRRFGTSTIITNGDQTDTIREGMAAGKPLTEALRCREFEPDSPNYTPRISGVVEASGSYVLSILKSQDGSPTGCRRFYFEYDRPQPGYGHFLHTYMGDGDPLPSFEGEPVQVEIPNTDATELAALLWDSLNEQNKVSLFVRSIDLKDGTDETRVINKYGESWSLVSRTPDQSVDPARSAREGVE